MPLATALSGSYKGVVSVLFAGGRPPCGPPRMGGRLPPIAPLRENWRKKRAAPRAVAGV